MSIPVLDTLSERGARFWVENEKLRWRAPKGVIRETDIQALRRHRDAVIAALRGPNLGARSERAAIREHDGGETRADAEQAAAAEQGFETPEDLIALAVAFWRAELAAVAGRWAHEPRGREHVEAARRFVAIGWAERAARLGWDEVGLFGVNLRAPWYRFDSMGAAFALDEPVAATAESVTFRTPDGRALIRWRATIAAGSVPVWEVPENG